MVDFNDQKINDHTFLYDNPKFFNQNGYFKWFENFHFCSKKNQSYLNIIRRTNLKNLFKIKSKLNLYHKNFLLIIINENYLTGLMVGEESMKLIEKFEII